MPSVPPRSHRKPGNRNQLQRPGTDAARLSLGGITPPEQCNGAEQVDDRSDVYALGVIMYQLVSSKLPFDAPAACVIMAKTHPPSSARCRRSPHPRAASRRPYPLLRNGPRPRYRLRRRSR